jgi:hypothetical protein
MPEDLEVLVTEFRADIKRYEAALRKQVNATNASARKIEQRFKKMNANIGRSFQRTFVGLAGAAGITLSVRKLGELATEAVKAGDSIGKAARTAGISAEALQELRFAAELTGSTTGELDAAVGRFTRRLGEARRGNEEYAKTFKQLGVAAGDTQENALEKVFRTLSDVEDITVRTSLATKAFGDDARRMALLVENGAEGLDAMKARARELDLVLSNETVASLEKANDRLTELDQTLRTKTQQSVADNIDAFITWKEVTNDLNVAFIKAAAGLAGLVRPTTVKRIRAQIERLEGSGLGIRKTLNPAEERTLEILRARLSEALSREGSGLRLEDVQSAVKPQPGGGGGLGPTDEEVREAQRLLSDLERAFNNTFDSRIEGIERARDAQIEALNKSVASAQEKADAIVKINQTADEQIAQIRREEAAEAKKLLADIERAHNKTFDSEIEGIERARDAEIEALNKSIASAQEKADATLKINQTADEQIAQIRRDEADRERDLLRQVIDERDRAAGEIIAIAEREFLEKRNFIEQNIADEERRNIALQALDETRLRTVAELEKQLHFERLQRAAQEAETFEEGFLSTLDLMIEESRSANAEIGSLYAETFGPGGRVSQAIGHSVADALVFGESLSESIQGAARAILADLIGALVQLGVQFVIQQTLGRALGQGAVAASAAQAATTAVAWGPAAALASLATLGANAGPAAAPPSPQPSRSLRGSLRPAR